MQLLPARRDEGPFARAARAVRAVRSLQSFVHASDARTSVGVGKRGGGGVSPAQRPSAPGKRPLHEHLPAFLSFLSEPRLLVAAATLESAALAAWSWLQTQGSSETKVWAAAEIFRMDPTQAAARIVLWLKASDPARIGQRRVVLRLPRGERAAQVTTGVALCAARGNGIAEDLAASTRRQDGRIGDDLDLLDPNEVLTWSPRVISTPPQRARSRRPRSWSWSSHWRRAGRSASTACAWA